MLKLYQRNYKPLTNDNVLQIKMKSNLNLDKLQTTFSSPSLVIPLFLPIDIHPTPAKGNPRSGLMHTHNPRVGSDLRNYLPLTGNLSMQEFCFLHSDNYIWDRKECKLLIDLFFLCRCMKMTEKENYIEEALMNRKSANALNNRLGFPLHQQKAQSKC